jgi:nitronate monooxygenase
MRHLDDFILTLGRQHYVPLMVGGMGVDVSTPALALAIARLGGIAHLSDAMLPTVMDRHFGTHYVQQKWQLNRASAQSPDKSAIRFDLGALREGVVRFVGDVMEKKRGLGGIFLNVMEKLTMAQPRETLAVRLTGALDAGIDGITLGAGLHLGSLELMRDHPRFHDAKIGIIVSSLRALNLFMTRAARVGRLPDYVVVEGPLAGGHLGFPMNWQDFDLGTIVREVVDALKAQALRIPVIAAGGIFTGSDAVDYLHQGAAAVQVATRFTVTEESGLPALVKQAFFASTPDDVEVNGLSSTGYPMRMLKQSPALTATVRPMCESFGYILDRAGQCTYNTQYYGQEPVEPAERRTCLCTMMHGFKIWTCGHTVSRLKETTHRLANGAYQLLTAEHVFRDYAHSTDGRILLPREEETAPAREQLNSVAMSAGA